MIRNNDVLVLILVVIIGAIILGFSVEDSQNARSYQQFIDNCGTLCR